MNIFKILASGDGYIYEPSINAFLAYLLDPYANHGLEDRFFKKFLQFIDHPISKEKGFERINFTTNNRDYNIFIETEYVVLYKENSNEEFKHIDIYIRIAHKNDISNLNFIIIENKIRNSSIKKGDNQIYKEWFEFLSDVEGKYEEFNPKNLKDNQTINFVFITPSYDKNSEAEFLQLKNKISDFKRNRISHKVWHSDKIGNLQGSLKSEPESIAKLLKQLLLEENIGLSDAIYEYCKHTLKAFLNFIENDFRAFIKEEPEYKPVIYSSFQALKSKASIKLSTTTINKIEKLYELISEKLKITDVRFSKTHLASFYISSNDGKNQKMFSLSQSRKGSLELIKTDLGEDIIKL